MMQVPPRHVLDKAKHKFRCNYFSMNYLVSDPGQWERFVETIKCSSSTLRSRCSAKLRNTVPNCCRIFPFGLLKSCVPEHITLKIPGELDI